MARAESSAALARSTGWQPLLKYAEIVYHQVDRLIGAIGHDRGRPGGLTHHKLHATEPGFKRWGRKRSGLALRFPGEALIYINDNRHGRNFIDA
jgi:hypothetical protein